ncbi:MAG: oligosaccharide flippase family protein [Promethearchaeia archaeon]
MKVIDKKKKNYKIFNLNFFKIFVKNALLNTSSFFINSTTFIYSIILTRIISKDIYGTYSFIMAIINIFSLFSIPGLKNVIFKVAAQEYDGVYFNAIKIRLKYSLISIFCLILFGLYFLYFNINNNHHIEIGLILIFSSFFMPLYYSLDLWRFLLKGKQRFLNLFFFNSITFILNLSLIILFFIYLSFNDLFLLIYINLGNTIIFNIIFTYFCKKYLKNDKLNDNWKKQGISLTFIFLSSITFTFLGSIIIGFILPLESVAEYNIIFTVKNTISLTILAIIEVIYPKIYKSNYNLMVLKKLYMLFIISFLLPIILIILIDYPFFLLYPSSYYAALLLLKLFLFIIPFEILSGLLGPYFIKFNLNKELNISKLIPIITTTTLYLILIPTFKIIGAVISSMTYYIILDICMVSFIRKTFKEKVMKF